MTSQSLEVARLAEILPLGERRLGRDRRAVERRREGFAVPVERRSWADRRRVVERRETAAGHIRNAIQLLEHVPMQGTLEGQQRDDVAATLRRLWLALREIELGNTGRYGRRS